MNAQRDTIFATRLSQVGDFQFDDDVARVFPDMIQRSVPGYGSILSLLGEIAETRATPDSNVYDLGCSLGASTWAIHQRLPAGCSVHAVDNSAAMMKRFRTAINELDSKATIRAIEADIRDVSISNASLVILNFTLQFIPLQDRDELIRRIADGTNSGGALVLSEKILLHDPDEDALLGELHLAYKRSNGYSELEIAQKRSALENTLLRESLDTHIARLRQAGYATVVPWLQCFNFVSILAIK